MHVVNVRSALLAAMVSWAVALTTAAQTKKRVQPPAHMPSDSAPSLSSISVSSFEQLDAAVQALASSTAGATIVLKAGRYLGTHPLILSRAISAASKDALRTINIWAEAGKEVVLDFSALRDIDNAAGQGITIIGDEYHLRGLMVEKAGHFGIHVRGSRNVVESCVARYNGNTGLQIGMLSGAANPGHLARDNLILSSNAHVIPLHQDGCQPSAAAARTGSA